MMREGKDTRTSQEKRFEEIHTLKNNEKLRNCILKKYIFYEYVMFLSIG